MRSSIALLPLALAVLVEIAAAQSPVPRLARRQNQEATTCSFTQTATGTIPATSNTAACAPSSVCGAATATSSTTVGGDAQTTTVQQAVATCAAPGPQRKFLRRTLNDRAETECPEGLTSCPSDGLSDGSTECVDLNYELAHCGACGQDCTGIDTAFGVGCEDGRCVVLSCEPGFEPTADRKGCMPATRPTGVARHRLRRSVYASY